MNQPEMTFFKLLKSTIKLIFTKKMMFFNLQLVFTGVSIAYWSGLLSPIIVFQLNNDPEFKDKKLTDADKDKHAFQAMIAFGVGEVLGGVLMGWFIDKYDSMKGALLNLAIIFLMTWVTLESIIS